MGSELRVDRTRLESELLSHKRSLMYKDGAIGKSKREMRDKVIKIGELEEKIETGTEEKGASEGSKVKRRRRSRHVNRYQEYEQY